MGDVTIQGARATTRAPEPPKAYLDNCIVGALVKGEFPEDELGAIYELIDLSQAERISLVTSRWTRSATFRKSTDRRTKRYTRS